jgi:hypothetical protein
MVGYTLDIVNLRTNQKVTISVLNDIYRDSVENSSYTPHKVIVYHIISGSFTGFFNNNDDIVIIPVRNSLYGQGGFPHTGFCVSTFMNYVDYYRDDNDDPSSPRYVNWSTEIGVCSLFYEYTYNLSTRQIQIQPVYENDGWAPSRPLGIRIKFNNEVFGNLIEDYVKFFNRYNNGGDYQFRFLNQAVNDYGDIELEKLLDGVDLILYSFKNSCVWCRLKLLRINVDFGCFNKPPKTILAIPLFYREEEFFNYQKKKNCR